MSTQQARVYNGRYELLRHIARGGMAEVYLAHDLLLDRPVALKVLFPELSIDRSFVERFRREAQAAANLSHQHIVSVYDWGEEDGTYFIVMEYVDGRPLSQVIRSEGRLLPDRAAQIGADVAAGLAFAHRHGVVHRDVKPGNVLIDSHGGVKVTDFGIARGGDTSESLTQVGSVMGTATYFSPEQAQGLPTDPRSDVYSLGVVLFEMVTGRPPFTGDSPLSIAYKHVREAPPRARQVEPAVPPSFETIIDKAMAKRVDDRYTSAEELRTDLIRFTRGQPPLSARTMVAAAVPAAPPVQRTMAMPVAAATTAMPAAAPVAVAPPVPDDEPVFIEDERPPRTGAFVGLFVVLLGVLMVLLFLLGRMIGLFGGGAATANKVTMPNLIGQTVGAAQSNLGRIGLQFTTTPQNADPSALVTGQDPNVNTKVDPGTTVKIFAGSNPATTLATVAVPDVTNQTQAAAESLLRSKGFIIGTVTTQPSDSSAGIVVAQDPVANTNAPPGSPVNLTVSAAKGATPNVVGEDASQAVTDLKNAGYVTVNQTQEASSSIPSGSVIRSSPTAGQPVPKSKTATIVVSSGKSQTTVPNVVNQTQSSATSQLKAKGFLVQVTFVDGVASNQVGRVIDQSPAGNSQADPGSTVVIDVGRSSTSTTTGSTSTTK